MLEFNDLKKEIQSGSEVELKAKSAGMKINEKRRKLWELLAVPRHKWSLYYVKYRLEISKINQ